MAETLPNPTQPEPDIAATEGGTPLVPEWLMFEERAYRRHLPELLKHPLDYVVIRDGVVFGVFADAEEADDAAAQAFPDGRYLLRLIGPEEALFILADPYWPDAPPESNEVATLRADVRRLEGMVAAMQQRMDLAARPRSQTATLEGGSERQATQPHASSLFA